METEGNRVNRFIMGVLGFTALLGSSPAGQTPASSPSNLWIGILHEDHYLEPVAALIDGKWWHEAPDDPDQHFQMLQRIDRVPAEWLPPGRPLPTEWQTHLVDGRTIRVRTSGPLRPATVFEDHLRLNTDLPPPSTAADSSDAYDDEWATLGIAISGTVDVRVFTPMSDRTQQQVRRFLEPAMLKAEQAAIKLHASSTSETARYFAPIDDRMIRAGRFELEHAVSSTQSDRSVIHYIEGGKTYSDSLECGTRIRAAAVQDRSGTLKVLEVQATSWCDLYVTQKPLAILERGGRRCWLSAYHYEDGVEFVLTGSRHISLDDEPPACTVK